MSLPPHVRAYVDALDTCTAEHFLSAGSGRVSTGIKHLQHVMEPFDLRDGILILTAVLGSFLAIAGDNISEDEVNRQYLLSPEDRLELATAELRAAIRLSREFAAAAKPLEKRQ